jgi:hypothetical protein
MQPSPFQQQASGPKLTSAEAAALRRVTPAKRRAFQISRDLAVPVRGPADQAGGRVFP